MRRSGDREAATGRDGAMPDSLQSVVHAAARTEQARAQVSNPASLTITRPNLLRATLELLLLWCLWEAGLAGAIYDALWRIAPPLP